MKKLILTLCLAATGTFAAVAQMRLTLDQALDLALSENPTVKVAEMEVQRYDYVKRQTWGGLLPQVSVTGQVNHSFIVQQMSKGFSLGKIEEIMLDVPGGRIAYAVMSSGGFLGLGEKLFAIPWGALTLDTNRECFVLDARAETFENAPGFDKDHWPTQAGDLQWHRDVHAHYGQSATPLGSVVR